MKRLLRLVACIALVLAPTGAVHAEYPNRPVTMIVPFGPGGPADLIARMIAPSLSQRLGQTVVVDNRPGAAGGIAALHVKAAEPDGYTILIAHTGAMIYRPIIWPSPAYNAVTDFSFVGRIGYISPLVLVVHKDIPVNTLDEFAAYVRTHKTFFAQSGDQGLLAAAQLQDVKRFTATRVPFKSEPDAIQQGLLSTKEVQWSVLFYTSARSFIDEGTLRGLVVLDSSRMGLLPNVPAASEVGASALAKSPVWIGLFGPKGLPDDIVQKLSKALKETLAEPAVAAMAEKFTFATRYADPQGFATEVKKDYNFTITTVDELKKKGLLVLDN